MDGVRHRLIPALTWPAARQVAQNEQDTIVADTEQTPPGLLEFALDKVQESVFLADEQGRLVYVNDRACRSLGYERDALLGMSVADVDPEWPAERWPEFWERLKATGSNVVETTHRGRDGQAFPVEVRANYFEFGGRAYNLGLVRDISERKQAERSLYMANFVLDAMDKGVYLIGEDYRFLYVNDGACRALGYNRDELLQMRVTDIDPEITREQLRQRRETLFAGGDVLLETVHRTKDGHCFPVEIRSLAVRFQDELMVLSFARDITARRAADEKLREKEQRYRDIFDNASDGLYLLEVTEEGRFLNLDINPALAKSVGIPREALIGHYVDETVSGQTAQAVTAKYRRCVEASTNIEEDVELELPSGRRYFHSSLIPLRNPHGRIDRIVGISRDITERKEMERALRAREHEVRALVENTPDIIARYDRDYRRLYVNPAMERLCDCPAAEILGRTPLEISPLPEPDTYLGMLREVFTLGKECRGTIHFHRADGEEIWGHMRMVPEFDPDGRVTSVLAIGRDIRDIKAAEKRLEESRALLRELAARRESAREEERKRLAREIHDEMGQLLMALRLDITVAQHQAMRLDPTLARKIGDLMGLSDRMSRVIRGMVSTLRPAALDMGLIPALEWLANDFFERTNIPCSLRLLENDVMLDEQLSVAVFRIVQESLTNVARHARAGQVAIILRRQEDRCVLEIRDDGCGFDPAAVSNHAFGLVGVQERALAVGGTATIATTPGQGTVVSVNFALD